ncbi:Flocculation protein FLO5, partial [Nakaseomyces glabratus]
MLNMKSLTVLLVFILNLAITNGQIEDESDSNKAALGVPYAVGNPITVSNVCSFPENWHRIAGFRALTARLGIAIQSDSYKELLNYPGTFQLTTQQSSTTKPNFQISGLVGTLYGLTIIPSYLLIELTGYFVPPTSGEYTFSLEGSDDAAIIFIANPSTFKCGHVDDWPTAYDNDVTVTDSIHTTRTIYMIEGVAYPIRIAYYNGLSLGKLQASFTDPEGVKRVDWNGYIWRYDACDTCSYVPPPTVVTTESSSWVLNPTTTGTSYSTALGIDGLPTTYTIYQVVVPTITESLAIPPPITQTDTHPDYLEEEVVSYYSTTNAEGSPITGTTTSTIRTILIIPPPITITVTKEGWEEEQEISYFSTTDANGNGITGTITKTLRLRVDVPTPYTTTYTSNHEQIEAEVSYIPTVDEDGKPTYFTTTKVIAISHLPPPPGYTVTIDVGNEVTHYEVVSYFTTEDENGKFYTGTSTVTFTPPSPTTITVTKEGVEETDYISFFITTDAEHNIITGSSVSKILDDGLDKTTVVTDEDGTVHTDIISHITTTDAEGNPTIILTTYPSPTDDGLDKTTVVTDEDGTVHTDIISHITTTDAEGNPTIILTTYPSPTDDGLDKTTVVTDEDGTVHTDIISHITTTDAEGNPTIILTTYPSPTDSIGNPIALSNVCSFPESRSRTAGFRVLTAGLGIWITSDSYKELLNYSGSSQLITQQSSTTQPNFEIGGLVGNIYGLTVVPSYLLVELTGYFVPPVSGEYSFSLEGSDDAAIIFIGNPSTFKCGNIEDWPTPNEADISVTDTIHASRTIYMVEGVAYPIRIAYYNGLSLGKLQASFTDPRGTSYSTALGIDGLPTTYTIYQVVVPTITESLAIPPPITQTDTHPDYLEEEVVSYYSTTNAEGSPITGTTTSTIRTILIIPPPITITVTKEGWEEEQEISYFSTTDANGNGITGSTTRTITFHVDLPTPFTTTFTSNHEQIEGEVSYIPTVDEDGKPTYFTTTKVIAISHLPPPPGYTVTIDVGNEVTHYEVVSYFTTEDENGKFYTGTSTVTFTPPSPTTITVTKEGVEETDYISFFITTDAEHNIITGSSVSKILDDGLDKTTVVTDEDGTVHTDIISHITTTDAEGNPTIILTTYPSPTDDGLDKTTVVTDEDGTVHTDIISHITTTDAEGNPTIILTTYPSPTDDGLDKTTVVTDEDGTVHTDIISHITTTDAEGNPTIILTTYPSPTDDGLDKTTVVTDEDGTVHTDIISHITTTDAEGNPTIILTTYPSPTDNVDISTSLPQPSTTSYTEDGVVIVEVVYVTTYTASNGDVILTTITELSKEMIDAGPIWVSPTTSTVTTVDSNGNTLTITTSYLIDNNGNTGPIPNSVISSSVQPSDDGLDKTTVVTDEDGTVHTDIISHITT